MPKISVYLPDDLYREARERGLSVSSLAQAAVADALERERNLRWISAVRARPRRVTTEIDTSTLLDEVREGFGS